MTLQKRHIPIVILWLLVVLALGWLAWVKWAAPAIQQSAGATIGPGDYELTATDGTTFTEDTLKGVPSAVFFGFTHCPEVCPTTLGDVASLQEELGPDSQLRVFFITVDPERDTVDVLRDYVTWVPGAVGVSGSPEEIEKAISAFRIYSRKVPLENGDYTMDHSANVLLFDAKGRFFEPVGYQEGTERVLDKIRRMQAG